MTSPTDHPDDQTGSETLPMDLAATAVDGGTGAASSGDEISEGRGATGGGTTQDFRNIPERYQDPETIGTGGIGVVTSCLDPNLGRRVAVKTLRRKYGAVENLRVRFVREARVMSQLEHPNIVPVHELGERPDGTVYFTMKQVHGESLEWVLQRLESGDPEYLHDYPASRLMDVFIHICQAIAFAHSREVLHRDLKPENVMIGPFGEVQTMDWGLVKIMGGADRAADPHFIHSFEDSPEATLEGQIAGTPLYMSPEQACGQVDRVDQRSDLYSLGAILYRILTRRHYIMGDNVQAVLKLVKEKAPVPPHRIRVGYHRVSRELSAVCMKALAKDQDERYQSVQELIDDLELHQRGLPVSVYREPMLVRFWKFCRRHPVVSVSISAAMAFGLLMMVTVSVFRHQRYQDLMTTAKEYKANGDGFAAQATATQSRLNEIRSNRRLKALSPQEAALTERLQEFAKQSQSNYDIARLLYAQAVPMSTAPILDFLGSIRLPGRPKVRTTTSDRRLIPLCRDLVDTYRRQIDCAMLAEDFPETRRLFGMMDAWVRRTPGGLELPFHHWRDQLRRRLEGYGALRLEVDEPSAHVRLYHLEQDRLLPDLNRPELRGPSSLILKSLRRGSYLLIVTVPEREDVLVPLSIGNHKERLVNVHVPAETPAGMIYIPAGEAIIGGTDSPLYRSREVHVPGFFIKRYEVTFAEYIEFWRQEPDSDRRLSLTPYVQLDEGTYCKMPAWDSAGKLMGPLTPDMPVVGISKQAADTYCRWLSKAKGREVRLPTADEWEKAARGVDGRRYPWGDDFQWPFAHLEETGTGSHNRIYAKPGSYAIDRSIYGVMDMGGNVREWTATPFPASPRRHQIKGGSLATSVRYVACAYADSNTAIPTDVGFRYVMPLASEK
jgi:eukaryotic-like serine/threonine-protein kinase